MSLLLLVLLPLVKPDDATEQNITIALSIVLVFGLILVVFFGVLIFLKVTRRFCWEPIHRRNPEFEHRAEENGGLIPPLFFTQGLKDPLMQDDLVENAKNKSTEVE